jgi:hypothetical protein
VNNRRDARSAIVHRAPHQHRFVALDAQQVVLHLGGRNLPRLNRHRGLVVGFAGDFAIKRGDQLIAMQPRLTDSTG